MIVVVNGSTIDPGSILVQEPSDRHMGASARDAVFVILTSRREQREVTAGESDEDLLLRFVEWRLAEHAQESDVSGRVYRWVLSSVQLVAAVQGCVVMTGSIRPFELQGA